MASGQSVLIEAPNNLLCWDRAYDNILAQKSFKKLDPIKFINPKVDFLRTSGQDACKKVENLEKALQFLQSHHAEVLSSLHEEVDNLKRQNQELLLKFAILQSGHEVNACSSTEMETSITAVNTTDKKCQTPRSNANDVSMKRQVELVNDQVKQLTKALREEELKASNAMMELKKLEMKNKQLESEVNDGSKDQNQNSQSKDKIHSKSPLGIAYSLPAISKNQFMSSSCQRLPKKILKDLSDVDVNKDMGAHEQEIYKRSSNICRSMFLSNPNAKLNGHTLKQFSLKKSSAVVQVPKINLAFSEDSSLTSLGPILHRRSEPRIRFIKPNKKLMQGSMDQADLFQEDDINMP